MTKTNFKCMYLIDEKLYKKKILNGDPRSEFDRRGYDIASSAGLEGMTRIVGPPDQQGPVGPTGAQGELGPPGPRGVEGPRGPEGPAGQTGPQGAIGPEGATGLSGPLGSTRTGAIDMTPGPVAMDITGPAGLVASHPESTPEEDEEEMDCAHCQLPDDNVDEPTSLVSDERSGKRKINYEIEPNLQKQIKYTASPKKEPSCTTSENDVFENEEWLEMKEWLRKMRSDIDFPPRRHTHRDMSKSQKLKCRRSASKKQTNKTAADDSNKNRKLYVCLICHTNFKQSSSLVKHARRAHSEYFENMRRGNKRKYETKTSNASNFKKQKAGEKTEEVQFKDGNIDPSSKKASPKKVMFICTYCLKKFQTKMLLKRHILIFHQTKKNIKQNLSAQIRTPQAERGKVMYFCSICNTRFIREKSLSNHVRRAHKEYFEQWEHNYKRKRASEPEGV